MIHLSSEPIHIFLVLLLYPLRFVYPGSADTDELEAEYI
jgi:hypothetical protein